MITFVLSRKCFRLSCLDFLKVQRKELKTTLNLGIPYSCFTKVRQYYTINRYQPTQNIILYTAFAIIKAQFNYSPRNLQSLFAHLAEPNVARRTL